MRILITVDPEIPVPPRIYGGIERIADGLVREFRLWGHQVGLVAHPDSTCPTEVFYPWEGLHSQKRVDALRNMRVLRRAVTAFQPDVLHSFSRILYMLPLVRASFPKIMSFQREPTLRTVFLGAALFNGSLSFTGTSEYIKRRGKRAGGDWRVIYNFVDTNRYRFQPKVRQDAPLVFLSRVERIKGAHTAIEVAQRTGRKLLIAGNHADHGRGLDYWRQEIAPRLDDRIEYVGPVDDAQKESLLGHAAALIVPVEWNEPFGIVFAEALACGTPVISCPRGALPEIVRHGTHGFLVDSITQACQAVESLDTIDRAACRERAEQLFSLPVITAQYEELYRERIAKP
jgi:glycosyltransferase involved in cell wall biosynthesis